jgi:hypothetical protein
MLRGIASLVAGFLMLPLLMRGALETVLAVWPALLGPFGAGPASGLPTAPPTAFMIVNLGLAVLTAGLVAAVAARLAPDPAFMWVLLLAFFVFTGGLVFGVQQTGGVTPTWYLLAMPLTSGLAIAAGGYAYLAWRDRRAGRRAT